MFSIKSTTILYIHLSVSFMFYDINCLSPQPSTKSASGSWSEGNFVGLTCWRLTPIDYYFFKVIHRVSGEALNDGDAR